jgi:copper ion binding protein
MATQQVTLKVQGMHCSSCTKRVERALSQVPGVSAVKVDLLSGQAAVEYAAGQTDEDELKEAVRALGYKVA